MTTGDSTKHCPKCNRIAPVSEFYRNARSKDGLRNKCKDCYKAYTREWRRKKRKENDPKWVKKQREHSRKRSSCPGRKKYRIANREKLNSQQRVHLFVLRAVQKGKLPIVKTLKCETCGEPAREYHHHLGYSKEHRLDVQPLCRICHCDAHAKMRLAETTATLQSSPSNTKGNEQ